MLGSVSGWPASWTTGGSGGHVGGARQVAQVCVGARCSEGQAMVQPHSSTGPLARPPADCLGPWVGPSVESVGACRVSPTQLWGSFRG